MTEAQVKWAKQHDWYVSAWSLGSGVWHVRVEEHVVMPSGNVTDRQLCFTDFAKLRAWAGY